MALSGLAQNLERMKCVCWKYYLHSDIKICVSLKGLSSQSFICNRMALYCNNLWIKLQPLGFQLPKV